MSLLLLLTGCSLFQTPPPAIKTEFKRIQIEIKEHPTPLDLKEIYWYVGTEETLDDFVDRLKTNTHDELAFYALSVQDYERMAINFSEITRYIKQQKELLNYYETAITNQPD